MSKDMADKLRLTITLSDFAARKLTAWARAHDKSRTAWAAQIVEARVEANLDVIDKLVADCAKAQNTSPEELERIWDEQDEKE